MAETFNTENQYQLEQEVDQIGPGDGGPGDGQPKPQKMSVNDFASKIKTKYPQYKDFDNKELVDKIVLKYPQYKEQIDFGQPVAPVVEKKSEVATTTPPPPPAEPIPSEPSATPSKLPSASKTFIGSGDIVRTKSGDLIRIKGEQKDYYTVENVKVPGKSYDVAKKDIETRGVTRKEVAPPLEDNPVIDLLNRKGIAEKQYSQALGKELMVQAQGIKGEIDGYSTELQNLGIKPQDENRLRKDFSQIPPELISEGNAYTKNSLIEDYKNNPPKYEGDMAYLKIVGDWNKATQEYGKPPSPYIKEKGFYAPEEIPAGDFELKLSTPEDIKRSADKINKYGGDKKDELLKNLSIFAAKKYGDFINNNPEIYNDDPRKAMGFNDNMIIALKWMEDTGQDTGGYDALLVDKKVIDADQSGAKAGWEEKASTLEQIGIVLRRNAAEASLNDLVKKQKDGTITDDETRRALELESQVKGFDDELSNLKVKYQAPAEVEAQNAAMEITNNFIASPVNRPFLSLGNATQNTLEGIVNFVAEPFRSDESSKLSQLNAAGMSMFNDVTMALPTEAQGLITRKLQVKPDLQEKLNPILNDKSLTKDQKTNKVYEILKDSPNDYGYVPLSKSRLNINPTSLYYSIVDLGATLVPFIGLEALTGGGATAGIARKLTSAFIAAATTMFQDQYVAAIRQNKPNPFGHALLMTSISSAFMAGAGTPALIKQMLGAKTAVGEMVGKLTDKEIQGFIDAGMKNGLIDNLAIAVKRAGGQGLKGGLTFETVMTIPKLLEGKIDKKEFNPEDLAKEALLGIINFTVFGAIAGTRAQYKNINELQSASLLKASSNPGLFIKIAQGMVKDGKITKPEYNQIVDNIVLANEAAKQLKFIDVKGKELPINQKGKVLVLKMQELKLKQEQEGAPEELKKDINNQLAEVKDETTTAQKDSDMISYGDIIRDKQDRLIEVTAVGDDVIRGTVVGGDRTIISIPKSEVYLESKAQPLKAGKEIEIPASLRPSDAARIIDEATKIEDAADGKSKLIYINDVFFTTVEAKTDKEALEKTKEEINQIFDYLGGRNVSDFNLEQVANALEKLKEYKSGTSATKIIANIYAGLLENRAKELESKPTEGVGEAKEEKPIEAPQIGDFSKIDVKMRYPNRNKVIYVSPDILLEVHAKDNPEFDVRKKEYQIGNRVEKAKEFLRNYLKDQRFINPKTGERTSQKVDFEPSIVAVDTNGKLSFEDGRHRVLAAKELGIKEVPIEVPKEQADKIQQLLGKPTEAVGEVAPEALSEAQIEEIKPIRLLGTGSPVYFETDKYRVNENLKNGKILLNIGGDKGEVPIANIEFDKIAEAVFVAKKLAEIYPKGVPNAVLIDKVVEGLRRDYESIEFVRNLGKPSLKAEGEPRWDKDVESTAKALKGIVRKDEYTKKVGDDLILKHGTPHDFSKFQLEKIGTGEGVQAFGYGLYFTDGSKIAEQYAKKLSQDKTGIVYEVKIIDGTKKEWVEWREPLEQDVEDKLYNSLTDKEKEQYQKYLDNSNWDNDYVGKFDELKRDDYGFETYDKPSAVGLLYRDLKDAFGQQVATDIFKRAGIDGIKYRSNAGLGDNFNYVVFDPNSIEIIKKEKPILVGDVNKLSEAYHADKAAGKETELTKAVEELLSKPTKKVGEVEAEVPLKEEKVSEKFVSTDKLNLSTDKRGNTQIELKKVQPTSDLMMEYNNARNEAYKINDKAQLEYDKGNDKEGDTIMQEYKRKINEAEKIIKNTTASTSYKIELQDVLPKEFIKKYPQLANIEIKSADVSFGKKGHYNPNTNTIHVITKAESFEHTLAHEIGHLLWDKILTKEQKNIFSDNNPITEHGKKVLENKETNYQESYGGKNIHNEEDFAELFAGNNGDLEKTISDKKQQILGKPTKKVGEVEAEVPIKEEKVSEKFVEPIKDGQEITFNQQFGEKLKGKKVTVPGFEGLDTIMVQSGFNYDIYELSTGMKLNEATSFSPEEAISQAASDMASKGVTTEKLLNKIYTSDRTMGKIRIANPSPAIEKFKAEKKAEAEKVPFVHSESERKALLDIAEKAKEQGLESAYSVIFSSANRRTGEKMDISQAKEILEKDKKSKQLEALKKEQKPYPKEDIEVADDSEEAFKNLINYGREKDAYSTIPQAIRDKAYQAFKKMVAIRNKYGYYPDSIKDTILTKEPTPDIALSIYARAMGAKDVEKRPERIKEAEAQLDAGINKINAAYEKEFGKPTEAVEKPIEIEVPEKEIPKEEPLPYTIVSNYKKKKTEIFDKDGNIVKEFKGLGADVEKDANNWVDQKMGPIDYTQAYNLFKKMFEYYDEGANKYPENFVGDNYAYAADKMVENEGISRELADYLENAIQYMGKGYVESVKDFETYGQRRVLAENIKRLIGEKGVPKPKEVKLQIEEIRKPPEGALKSEENGERLSYFKKGDIVYRNYGGRYEEYEIIDDKGLWKLKETRTGNVTEWNADNNEGFILKEAEKPEKSVEQTSESQSIEEELPLDQKGRKIGSKEYKKGENHIIGRTITRTTPDGKKIRGTFKLVPASELIPSHNPLTFSKNEKFPQTKDGKTINDRDYERSPASKQIVIEIAQKIDGTAVTQMPTVSKEGIVYDGNNRTMSRQLAAKNKTDRQYLDALKEQAEMYGFTEDQVDKIKDPTLVFEVEENLPFDTKTMAMFNKQEKKSQTPTERAVAISKRISDRAKNKLAQLYEQAEVPSDVTSDPKLMKRAIDILLEDGIVQNVEIAGFVDNTGVATTDGVSFLEGVVLAASLNENAIIGLSAENMGNVKRMIIKNIVGLMQNSTKGKNSLIVEVEKAIEIVKSAKASKISVIDYLSQYDAFAQKNYTIGDMCMALLLDTNKPTEFKNFLLNYNSDVDVPNLLGEDVSKQAIIDRKLNTLISSYDKIKKNLEGVAIERIEPVEPSPEQIEQPAREEQKEPAEIPAEKPISKEEKIEKFNKSVDEKAEKLKNLFIPKHIRGISKKGLGIEELIDAATKIIKEAYRAKTSIQDAIERAVKLFKDNWDKDWGDFDESAARDILNEIEAPEITEQKKPQKGKNVFTELDGVSKLRTINSRNEAKSEIKSKYGEENYQRALDINRKFDIYVESLKKRGIIIEIKC